MRAPGVIFPLYYVLGVIFRTTYRPTGLVSSFGGCMAQASYFDTARRPVSFLAKKARFVKTSKVRSCHKATYPPLAPQSFKTHNCPPPS